MIRAGLAVVVSLGVLDLVACASASGPPCSPTDAVMVAKAAECRWRVETECADLLDSDCPVIKECDEWGEKRCGFGAGGSK